MVSQLIFGETATVKEILKDFINIKCTYDDYEGWVQVSQVVEITESFSKDERQEFSFKRDAFIVLNNTQLYVSVATPALKIKNINDYKVDYNNIETLAFNQIHFTDEIIKTVAMLYLNVPYLWGGKSSFGIDCSGFTQQVFKMFSKKLLRDSFAQATQGEVINSLTESQCGDLAFFNNEEDHIIHVGILLGNNEIIHASGNVRIDKISTEGIINVDTNKKTHQLKIIKRI
jgi:cell wall-associated NlpC family hydrolase